MTTRVELKFEPRDLWVGLYWNRGVELVPYRAPYETWARTPPVNTLLLYFCLLPMLVIKVTFILGRS